MKTAIILGATGLVGTELTRQLLDDPDYGKVITFGRRAGAHTHEKLVHHQVDFEQRATWTRLIQGDAFFSAMGTTIKVAGSQDAQWRVDHDYQLWGLQAAKENGVRSAVLVSSTGADPDSFAFYTRMKGTLDDEFLALGMPNSTILRPGMLDGDRKESRPGEKIGLAVGRLVPKWNVLAKARPVHVSIVAQAARAGVKQEDGSRIWEASDVFHFGDL